MSKIEEGRYDDLPTYETLLKVADDVDNLYIEALFSDGIEKIPNSDRSNYALLALACLQQSKLFFQLAASAKGD